MNSLLSYGSDDDSDDSGNEKYTDPGSSRNYRKMGATTQEDVNYDEVGMDMSEDSDREQPKKSDEKDSRKEERRSSSYYDRDSSSSTKSRDEKRRYEDKYSARERDEERSRNRREERDKDEDRTRDRYREKDDRDDDRGRDRYRDDRRDKRDERDDKYRDRKDRELRRSRSRERRRSRSPRRSRSRSKDRGSRGGGYSRRYERANNKMDKLDKMGIEIKTPDCQYVTPADLKNSMSEEKNESKDRFFMPGITGRFREQIERRKMLWQKGKEPEKKVDAVATFVNNGASGSRAAKVYEATSFADDKTSNKFKRLMGIKDSSGDGVKNANDVLKKQEEMFSSMEQQYEVARTATHTMRGVGLGFGSFQR